MGRPAALSTYRQQGVAATAALAAYRQHLQQSAGACLKRLRCKTHGRENGMNPEPKSTSPLDPSMLKSYPGPKNQLNHEKEKVSNTLKEQINNLLWAVLPPSTTLYDADELAAKWYAEVMVRWEHEAEEETP